MPSVEPYRLAVAGDVGVPTPALAETAAAMARAGAERPFDALLLLGDNVYPDGDPAMVEQAVLRPFAPVLAQGTQLLAVLGNHDIERGEGDEVARRLGMPGRWYERRLGPIQLIAVDTTRPRDRAQRAWLDDVIDGPSAPFRVVAMHHPPYSSGWHGSSRRVRWAFRDAIRRGGVDLVLAGHEHDYQRSTPIDGTTYVISGGAAQLRRSRKGRRTAVAERRHHFLDVRATPTELDVRAVDHDGAVFDRVVLPVRPGRLAEGAGAPDPQVS